MPFPLGEESLSKEDWYGLLYTAGSATSSSSVLSDETKSEDLLRRIETDSDSVLRINFLILLQDSAAYLADDPELIKSLFSTLQKVSHNSEDDSVVRSQALITQTTLSIDFESLGAAAPAIE